MTMNPAAAAAVCAADIPPRPRSIYNDGYQCEVLDVDIDPLRKRISVHICIEGDMTLGPLQAETASRIHLSVCGINRNLRFSFRSTDSQCLESTRSRRWKGWLHYDNVGAGLFSAGAPVEFEYGSSGYSSVKIACIPSKCPVSMYNTNYFCEIEDVLFNPEERRLSIRICENGDMSLGEMQRPQASTLYAGEDLEKFTCFEHTMIAGDLQRKWRGILHYIVSEKCTAPGTKFQFQYGTGGYQPVLIYEVPEEKQIQSNQ